MGVKRRASAAAAKALPGATKRAKIETKSERIKSTGNLEESDLDESEEPEDDSESVYGDDSEDHSVDADEDDQVSSSASEEPEEDSDEPKSKRRFASASKPKGRQSISAKDAARSGKTGLGPGTQVILKKPKARDAGDTPYEDGRIHPNTLLFLHDLSKNNDRNWLKANDPDFRASENDWKTYVDVLTEKIAEIDETIPELPYKDLNFRIYRDVRFSKNKTPYKTSFGAAWSRTGRKGPYAVYYIQIKPNKGSLVGKSRIRFYRYFQQVVAGGLWQPEASALARLRNDIDRRSNRLLSVLKEPSFRKEFLDNVSADEKKCVARFVAHNQDSALKTKPKGFDSDHKDIELLRLRNFTVSRKIEDKDITGPTSIRRIGELVAALTPFVTYLNSVVMPDDISESEEVGNNGSGADDEEGLEESDRSSAEE